MHALEALSARGLSVEATGTRLTVWPAEHLDDHTREFIRNHKAEILAELDVWTTLASAIAECCLARGDSDAIRIGLLADCYAMPLGEWELFARYFQHEARQWREVTGE